LTVFSLLGGSSGAAVAAAVEAAKRLKAGQKCVIILADTLRNYMTKFLDDKWLVDHDIIKVESEEKLW
jgi:cystathionine beta-synthase